MNDQAYSPEKLLSIAKASVLYYIGQFCHGTFTYEDAEDIIQDVVYKALRSSSRYSAEKGAYSTWVRTIALNTIKTAMYERLNRKEALEAFARDYSLIASGASYESSPDSRIRTEQAESELYSQAYTERDRTILRMRVEGYEPGEIAKELSLSPSKVYQAVHRVRTRLDNAA